MRAGCGQAQASLDPFIFSMYRPQKLWLRGIQRLLFEDAERVGFDEEAAFIQIDWASGEDSRPSSNLRIGGNRIQQKSTQEIGPASLNFQVLQLPGRYRLGLTTNSAPASIIASTCTAVVTVSDAFVRYPSPLQLPEPSIPTGLQKYLRCGTSANHAVGRRSMASQSHPALVD